MLLYILEERYYQFILEYQPKQLEGAFIARYNSQTLYKASKVPTKVQHLCLGYLGLYALEYLVNYIQGAKINGILIVKCNVYIQGKIKRQIRQELRDLSNFIVGKKLAFDFYNFKYDSKGYTSLLLITDYTTSYFQDYYLLDQYIETIIKALNGYINHLFWQYNKTVKAIEYDNEIVIVKP